MILSVLAVIAAGPIGKARERAMHGAARTDLARALRAVEIYQAENMGQMPPNIAALESANYTPAPQIQVCRFQRNDSAVPANRTVEIDMKHRGTDRGVTSIHPTWGGRINDRMLPNCSPVAQPVPTPTPSVTPTPTPPPANRPPGNSGGNSFLDLLRRLFGR
jgi:type II secretory pathway pseudopilin PulG